MIYSLIGVHAVNDKTFGQEGTINGNWIQDKVGTLEEAIAWAVHTEKANGNKIDVAVVQSLGSTQTGEFVSFRRRLDQKRADTRPYYLERAA